MITSFVALTHALRVNQTQILQIIWLNVNYLACLPFQIGNLLNICDTFEEYLPLNISEMLLIQVKSNLHRPRAQDEIAGIDCCLVLAYQRPLASDLKI